MISFDIHPFEGAGPIKFGTSRSRVLEILSAPRRERLREDSWGPLSNINVGYNEEGKVCEVGLRPGDFELRFNGRLIWSPDRHPDPNPIFLVLDPEPLERVGFLVFTKLGVATVGYHDDDPAQFAVSIYQEGAWDELLVKARRPDLDKYKLSA